MNNQNFLTLTDEEASAIDGGTYYYRVVGALPPAYKAPTGVYIRYQQPAPQPSPQAQPPAPVNQVLYVKYTSTSPNLINDMLGRR